MRCICAVIFFLLPPLALSSQALAFQFVDPQERHEAGESLFCMVRDLEGRYLNGKGVPTFEKGSEKLSLNEDGTLMDISKIPENELMETLINKVLDHVGVQISRTTIQTTYGERFDTLELSIGVWKLVPEGNTLTLFLFNSAQATGSIKGPVEVVGPIDKLRVQCQPGKTI
jgi:hypothetical protein